MIKTSFHIGSRGVIQHGSTEKKKGRSTGDVGCGCHRGDGGRGQLTSSEYTIPFPKRHDVNCTLVAYLRLGVDMSVTR